MSGRPHLLPLPYFLASIVIGLISVAVIIHGVILFGPVVLACFAVVLLSCFWSLGLLTFILKIALAPARPSGLFIATSLILKVIGTLALLGLSLSLFPPSNGHVVFLMCLVYFLFGTYHAAPTSYDA